MSISTTTNLCPDCDKQTLDAISAPGGNWFACPQCGGILIHKDVMLSLSEHRTETEKTLEETKSFLLPTEKICPICSKKLFDGRAWSRGFIFTLCSECHHFWTTLATLGQLDAGVEFVVHGATEAPWAAALDQGVKPIETKVDAGPGHFLRGLARLFDQIADRFSKKTTHTPVIPKYAQLQTPPPAAAPIPAPAPKPAPAFATPPTPATSQPPFISSLPDNPQDWPPELLAEFQKMATEKFSTTVEPPSPAVATPPPSPTPVTPAPAPVVPPPVVKVEPPPIVKVEPAAAAPTPAPAPKPVPLPVAPPPVAAPKEFKGFDYVAERTSLIDKLKAAWANRPKPASAKTPASAGKPAPEPKPIPVPPPVVAKPVEKPKPVPAPVVVPKPAPASAEIPASAGKPAPAAKPEKARGGFLAAMKAAWNPQPKTKATPATTPTSATSPTSQPVPKPVAAAVPKPKKEKGPKEPSDALLLWLPWGLLGLFVFLSSFREYGFENEPAILWGLMGWAIGMIVRAILMYPFQSFQSSTLFELAARADIKGWRGVPVQLSGDVVLGSEAEPKGVVVFEQAGERIALSRVTLWDILPRLFGLANPRQLLRGAVTITGWYRRGLVPSIEVHEIRTEKATRKSLVKVLRIGLPAFLFLVAFVINLSLE